MSSFALAELGFHRGSHLLQENEREAGVTRVTGGCRCSGSITGSWVGFLADERCHPTPFSGSDSGGVAMMTSVTKRSVPLSSLR